MFSPPDMCLMMNNKQQQKHSRVDFVVSTFDSVVYARERRNETHLNDGMIENSTLCFSMLFNVTFATLFEEKCSRFLLCTPSQGINKIFTITTTSSNKCYFHHHCTRKLPPKKKMKWEKERKEQKKKPVSISKQSHHQTGTHNNT